MIKVISTQSTFNTKYLQLRGSSKPVTTPTGTFSVYANYETRTAYTQPKVTRADALAWCQNFAPMQIWAVRCVWNDIEIFNDINTKLGHMDVTFDGVLSASSDGNNLPNSLFLCQGSLNGARPNGVKRCVWAREDITPKAWIDQGSLTTTSSTPTITGTAANAPLIRVSITGPGLQTTKVYESARITTGADGRWSVRVSSALAAGTYVISVFDANSYPPAIGSGRLVVNGNTLAPTGTISATPNPCVFTGTSTLCTSRITWSTTNAPDASVFVGSKLMARQSNGSKDAPWIRTTPLTFDLHATNNINDGKVLASVSVRGVALAPIETNTEGDAEGNGGESGGSEGASLFNQNRSSQLSSMMVALQKLLEVLKR